MLDRTWKNQPIKTQEPKTKSEMVMVLEENGVLIAHSTSNETESSNLVAILGVDSNREGVKISQLYNKMVAHGIKVTSLNSVAEAAHILGSN